MGYTTDFEGKFTLDQPLTQDQINYINAFSTSRRMKRDPKIASTFPDPKRIAVGLPVGIDGEFFIGNTDNYGQSQDESVLNYNDSPNTQPGLWCKWEVSEDGKHIIWNGVEKFYKYIDWLEYIVNNFLKPWGRVLNGSVSWQGEDPEDIGRIIVEDNKVGHTECRYQ